MATHNELVMIAERLGSDATADDAQMVADLAEALAGEQGDTDFDLQGWLFNRTYDWSRLWEAANGDVSAIAEVRAEAGLQVLA
jgi:hypothetical protein